LHNFLL